MPQSSIRTATIDAGASLSGVIDLSGGRPFAFQMPAAWTAASLTFQASAWDGTFQDVYDEAGNEVAVVVAAARFVILDPARWLGIRVLKIRSGTTGTPVNQAAARSIQIVAVE